MSVQRPRSYANIRSHVPRARVAQAALGGCWEGDGALTSQGNAYARFRRALRGGNPLLVRAAAAELPQVSLSEALAICLVFARSEPAVYDRAAVRWLGRLLIETRAFSLADAELLARTLREAPAADRLAAVQRELTRLLTARGQASLLAGLA